MSERTTAQICARMREIRESRTFHHQRKQRVEKCETVYEQTMVVKGGRKRKHYMTAVQLMQAYEQEQWEGLETRRQMFEAGKGTRFTKRTHVNNGAHYTKGGGVTTTKRPTAHGEVCSIGRQIVVKRFSNSRLTCVCKSIVY